MSEKAFPQNWQIGQEYDPNEHLMKLERYDKKAQCMVSSDYLNVQNRLLWFIRDQRALIVAGLATMPYIIRTELVEHDRERGWAHYKTYIRDVLGNEATMYGQEDKAGFPDYTEKASTKSLGRALLLLGYGTAFAPEMDEGDDVVDTPQETRASQNASVARQDAQQTTRSHEPVSSTPSHATSAPASVSKKPVTSGGIFKYLHDNGYTSMDTKEQAIKAAGCTVKIGPTQPYTDDEVSRIVRYVQHRKKEKQPA